jgi:hypothetical protein
LPRRIRPAGLPRCSRPSCQTEKRSKNYIVDVETPVLSRSKIALSRQGVEFFDENLLKKILENG